MKPNQPQLRLVQLRSPAPAPVPVWRRVVEGVLTFVAGLQFAAIGFGGATLFALNLKSLQLAGLGLMTPLLFIGLFGANMIVQAVRGRSRHEGFFYTLLRRITGLGPRFLSLGIPAFLAIALALALATRSKEALEMALGFTAVWVGVVANTFVHEIGHVLAARSAGLSIDRVVFGPVEVRSNGAGYEWGFSNHWLAVAGGFVIAQSTPPPTPRQTLTFALGGPAATAVFLAALVCFNPYDLLTLLKVDSPSAAFVFYGLMAATFTLIFNLLPVRNLGFGLASDGFLIRESLRAIRDNDRGSA